MATLQTLIDLWDLKAGGYRDSLPNGLPDKIRLLNAAKNKVWSHLVAAGRVNGGGNWFVKDGTLTLGSGAQDVDLPSDFHNMAFVQATTAGWEGVRFAPSDYHKDVYRENRQQTGNATSADGTRLYVIGGDTPARFNLDRPTAGIALKILYTSLLPEYAAATDVIDRVPSVYQDAIVNLAAMMGAMSRQDAVLGPLWQSLWAEDKALIIGGAGKRQIAGNVGVVETKPYDNIG